MRRLFELITILSVAAIALLVWMGQQRAPDPYLRDIQGRGVLRVGIDPTYPPFDLLREGKVEGYDAEMARAIAADLGVTVEFQTLALDTLYDALEAGKVDMLISALPFIFERQGTVRYSAPYYQAGQVLVTQVDNSNIKSITDLQNKTVGVALGSSADTEARRLARSTLPQMQLRPTYHTPEDALDSLVKGDVDAVIADNVSVQSYLQAHTLGAGGSAPLQVLSPPLTDEPFVVAMPGRATGLSARVDELIARLRASGELGRMMGLSGR